VSQLCVAFGLELGPVDIKIIGPRNLFTKYKQD